MNNPYAPSATNLSEQQSEGAETYQPYLCQVDGRIGRVRYIAYTAGPVLLLGLLYALLTALLGRNVGSMPSLVMGICIAGTWLVMMRRRLNDMGRTGWWVLVSLVPIINILLWLWLLAWPGDEGENEYGFPSVRNSRWLVAAAVISVTLMTLPMALGFIKGFQAGLNVHRARMSSGF
jgi:uncharacterized membrane protein YhaH (DUF805 family)